MHVKQLLIWFSLCFNLIDLTNAIECYTCDSAKDKECAINPGQQIEVEECTSANDECVTTIDAGYTRRGCFSRLFPTKYCNSKACERCNTSLCNGKIYPTDRLKCYQCVGCTDVSKLAVNLQPCPIYKEKDRCYTNINDHFTVQRGCEGTDLPDKCDGVCLKCNYQGCNIELGVTEQSCISCTHFPTQPNAACLRGVEEPSNCHINISDSSLKRCTNKIVYGHKARCYTHIEPMGYVTRGCESSVPFFSTGETHFCYGENCNTDCVNIACKTCSSNKENLTQRDLYYCRKGVNLHSQLCNKDVYDCYSCETGNTISRGCADEYFRNATNALTVTQFTSRVCYKCRDLDGCNVKPTRTCYQCSSLDNADCATLNDRINANQQRCAAPDESCVSTLVKTLDLVYVMRGCADNLPECTKNDAFCIRCNASLCNHAAIPIVVDNNIKGFRMLNVNEYVENRGLINIKLLNCMFIFLVIFLIYNDILLCVSFMLDCVC